MHNVSKNINYRKSSIIKYIVMKVNFDKAN
jgi:hypothetical protein